MLHIQKAGRKTILCGLAVCLCLCLLFTGVMLVAFAAENRAATPCAESDCNGHYENGFCTANSAHYQAAEKNADGYYEISNAGQLYWFADKVNGGEMSLNGKLTADIDVTAKSDFAIGIQAHPFGGVFDGNGHTLMVNIASTEEAAAPFSYAGGATFKNLTIAGTVATSAKYAGGFVGSTTGSLTFEKCLSLVTINSTLVGDGTHGGFVGVVNDVVGASVTMTDCGFIGAINGSKTTSCGGLFGWLNAKTTVTNSFVAADYTISNENGNAVARNDKHLTVNNVYYLNMLGGAPSGAIAITADQLTSGELTYKLGSAWKQTLGTDAYPNFSGQTLYGADFDCTGKPGSYNNTAAGTIPAHKLVNGVCTSCGGYEEPTLNSDGYYEIGNAGELEWFSAYVNNGHGNTNAILTADIDLTGVTHTPIGVNYSDFAGVFDGKGFAIRNMEFTCVQNGYGGNLTYNYQGLFGVIVGGATVKNFTVYGEIILAADNQKYIGGAVGLAYSGAKIENVASYVNITDNRGEGETGFSGISQIGGVVGQLGNTKNGGTSATAQNCRYYGTIDVNTAASVGGIAGQGVKNSLVQNCVNYGTVGWNYIGHAGGVVGSAQFGTQVKNCINRGKVSITRNDCVGGVVGYANDNVYIENCANYADIEAKKSDIEDEPDVYLGGILGYVNNGSFGGLTGCFNYGNVTDLDGAYTYTGAIVGYVNSATNADVIQNNAYLDTSCSKAYGTVSSSAQPEDPTKAAPLPSNSTTWTSGWYYVQGDVTFDSRVTISGDVKLILLDGATLTVNGGIGVNEGNTFTVYAQSDETAANLGKLIAQNVENKNTGIGRTDGDDGGTITINGGTISATSGGDSYDDGIGSNNCNITVNGGNITANSYGDNGIRAYTFTVNGGNITTNGLWFGISAGNITVNGGNITANGDVYGIDAGTFTVNGGTIIASGSSSVFYEQPTLNGNYRFFFGSSLSDLTAVPYVSVITGFTSIEAAKLEPCMVHDFAVTCIDETTHATQCKWCGYRKQTQDHDLGESNMCACGYGHVTYREYDPKTKQFETKTVLALPISSVRLDWASGWYYVQGDVTLYGRATVSGDVKLILLDGATLTVNGGICVNEGNAFTVYAQSDETAANLGKLIASATDNYMAGIGGNKYTSAGTISIHGGNITAIGREKAAGIGGGGSGENTYHPGGGTITIHGGIVNAEGGDFASGIGGGEFGSCGTVTINGGVVSAEGGNGGAGIGTGWTDTDLSDGTIIINGGVITARAGVSRFYTGDNYATGIGTGYRYGERVNVTITINGGTITAIGTGTAGGKDKYGAFSCAPVFGDNYRLCAGSSEDTLADVPYTGRDGMITSSTVAELTPCTEHVSIYAYVDGSAHAESCKWCGSASNKAHATDENGLCICGASEHIYLSYNTETVQYDTKTVYALPLPSGNAWTSDWYYVQGDVTLDSRVTVSGNVKLILCNGATLTVNGGIQINGSKTLAVYAQSLGATVGKLTVQSATSGKVGISGTLTVCGGQIMAYGSGSANAFDGTIDFRTNNHTVYGGTSRATLAPIAASSDACKGHKVLLIVCGTMSGEISADVVWTSMEFTYTDSTWDPATHSYTGGWTTTGGTVTVTNRGTSALTAQLAFTGVIDGISGTLSKTDMTIAAGASDTAKLFLTGKPGTALDHAALGNITVTLRAPRNGWYYDTSGSAYLYRDGSPLTGWQTIDGTKYHFAESGALSGDICDIGGNRYFFGIYGDMLTGWQTDASGNKYYADTSDGHLLTGWQDIAEKTYYFYPADSDTPYVMATGAVTIDEYGYYFGTDGSMGTGWQRNSDGKRYYADENGHLLTGWQDIDGKRYYFYPADSATPYVMATGKVEIEGKSYFFTSSGYLSDNVEGFVTEDGKTYFYIDGEVYKKGWLYLDANGAHNNIGNAIAKYYFDPGTGIMQTGWLTVTEQSGAKKTYTYYLDPATGAAVVGRQTIDGKEYAFTAYRNRVYDGQYGSVLEQNDNSTWLSCVLPDGSTRYYNFSGREVQDLSSNPYLTIDDDLSLKQGLAVHASGAAYYVKDYEMEKKRSGWIIEEEGIYYLPTSGKNIPASGTTTIDGVQYTFDQYYRCQNPPESVLQEYEDKFSKKYTP